MHTSRQRWRVNIRADAISSRRRRSTAQRTVTVAALGLVAGVATVVLAGALSPHAAPLAVLLVLLSTLLAGRFAPTGPALAHGACAWLALVLATPRASLPGPPWHGIAPVWLMLLLIEDMALIGRIAMVRHLVAHRRDER